MCAVYNDVFYRIAVAHYSSFITTPLTSTASHDRVARWRHYRHRAVDMEAVMIDDSRLPPDLFVRGSARHSVHNLMDTTRLRHNKDGKLTTSQNQLTCIN